MILVLKINNLY